MRLFSSPQEYIQGEGVFTSQLNRLKRLGSMALLVSDAFVLDMLGNELVSNLEKIGFRTTPLVIDDKSLASIISEASALIAKDKGDFVIALGGGKAMDIGKVIANQESVPIAILPTSAATDAATSRISVQYDAEGRFLRYDYYPNNPEIVMVDTRVIIKAPAAMLIAGFADGVATYIEARSIWKDGNPIGGGSLAAYSLAQTCHDILLSNIHEALVAQAAGKVNDAFENVVEANILLSGLGFENCGLSLAHGLHNVLMGQSDLTIVGSHGQIIAVGVLFQLLAENNKEYQTYRKLFKDLGLPVSLKDLSVELSQLEILKLAEAIMAIKDAGNHVPQQIKREDLVEALIKIL